MGGNILCVMPWSGDFPFDTLGGVGMAVCFVYIIYKQYLFSFSMRATTGAVYLIAVVVAFLPMIILEPNIDHVSLISTYPNCCWQAGKHFLTKESVSPV